MKELRQPQNGKCIRLRPQKLLSAEKCPQRDRCNQTPVKCHAKPSASGKQRLARPARRLTHQVFPVVSIHAECQRRKRVRNQIDPKDVPGSQRRRYSDSNGGNHSLATAKSCYEELKAKNPGVDLSNHPARYALVELENIHDEAQQFEPIHRVVVETDPEALLAALEPWCAPDGYPITWYAGEKTGTVYLDRSRSQLEVGVLQQFLDEYLAAHPGKIDYIHGDEDLKNLARQDRAIGFLLPAMAKSQLFRGVVADGVLPRKTFSMGHAREKRYYLEGRTIK